jgi:hypothetical protein
VRGGNEDERAARAHREEPPPQPASTDPRSWLSTCAGWRGGFHERTKDDEPGGRWRCKWCWQIFNPPIRPRE